ncbi:MAG: protein-L-isoaspartate(D-aspartate) O-methyltransferase [Gammaproteobacteria bacterium]
MTDSKQGIGMTSLRVRERLVQRLRETGIRDERVLAQIAAVPRHWFVDEALATRAYEDTALPIGYEQTVSQPWIVARMSEALLSEAEIGKVLELGTGSGYQTAVLAGLFQEVYSIERIRPLHERAQRTLRQLGLRNLRLRYGDGLEGWPEAAPFAAILITAAVHHIPLVLQEQLMLGGRLIAPRISERGQELIQIVREDSTQFKETSLGPVLFVRSRKGVE